MPEIRYKEISAALEAAIDRNEYAGQLPGVSRLAAELDTSPVTMSKALKLLEKRGVITIIDRKGAFINPRLNRRPTRNTVCLVSRYLNPNDKNLLCWGAEQLAQRHGLRLINLSAANMDILRDENFLEVINVDGYLFSLGTLDPVIARNLTMHGIPFVTINRIDDTTPMNWVEHDHDTGVTALYQHLYDLGHRRIAHFGLINRVSFFNDQLYRLYRRFMEARHIYHPEYFSFSRKDIWQYIERYGDSWEEVFAREQVDRFLRLRPLPSALVFADRHKAEKLVVALAERGIAVPRDLSVASFELDFGDCQADRAMTVIRLNETRRLRQAFKRLLQVIANPAAPPVQELIPETIVTGESTAAPPEHAIVPQPPAQQPQTGV